MTDFGIILQTQDLHTIHTELFICKTPIKYSESLVAQKAQAIRYIVLFSIIQSLLSPSSIIKHVVIFREYFKKYKVQSWKKSMAAQFVCSV